MASLALIVDGVVVQRFELDKPELSIGRHPECDIQIDDAAVSTHHARIIAQPSRYMADQTEVLIEDLGSTNGTFINGTKVEKQQLSNDDEVRVAWNTFKFIDDTTPDFERTAVILDGGIKS